MHPQYTRSLIAGALVSLAACGRDVPVAPNDTIDNLNGATPSYAAVMTSASSLSMQVGDSYTLQPSSTLRRSRNISWRSSSSSIASVSSSGTVRAYRAGTATVTASGSGVTEQYTVAVTSPTPVVTGFNLTPATGVALAPGNSRQFTSTASWSDGATRAVTVNYSAAGGTITTSGLFTAGSVAGTFMVIANCTCGMSDTAQVQVNVPAQLQKLTINPKTVTVQASASQQFGVTANWSTGATDVPPVTWSATGGTVSASGAYVAPSAAGTYRVIVAHTGGTVRDTAVVTVTAVNAPTGDGSTSTGGTNPFFQDNFDTGARVDANGFKWTSASWVSVSNELAYSGRYALRFEYGPAGPGEDGMSEQRFDMGRYLSDVTVEYMLYVPANFRHRLDDRVTNNKFLMLWRDTYGSLSGTWQIGWEYLRGTDDLTSAARFMSSRWDCAYVTDGCDWPNPSPPGNFNLIGQDASALKIGQWNKVKFRAKAASSRTASDGVATLWINDRVAFTYSLGRFHNFDPAVTNAVLRNGYLMGWANSGFAEKTVFYIDDVKFYN